MSAEMRVERIDKAMKVTIGPRRPPPDDRMIETCLVCLVAWDTATGPPRCQQADHPHSLASLSEWSVVGHGLASHIGGDTQPVSE